VSPELDVSQCVEPLFARVLGHDHFFSVYISKLTGKTLIRDGIGEESPPLQLGSHTPQDVIPPCSNRCQYHVLGHIYTGDMLGFQSVEQLDERRRVHNLGEVPDRFLGLGTLSPAAEDNQTVADGAAASARSSNVYGSLVDFWDPPVRRPPTEAGELVIDEAEQRAMRERKRAGDDHPHVMR
ncbi:MAG: hypothetical protein K0Q74_1038, partial [Gammaproteobacteria bacterium]|nr:hypothetical protein [Gammaproteobacteria bacterium]